MIKAVIFDMDGLLIDSEPLWQEAEIEVLDKVGIQLTKEEAGETMGLRVDEVVEYWFSHRPWKKPSKKKIENEIVTRVVALIGEKGRVCEGVEEIIELFDEQGIPLAIASSSPSMIIDAVLDKISIRQHIKVVHSAETEIRGKPHPGVYITTAKKLGIPPEQCLVFEDSPNGVLAAKAAKMICVAVPHSDIKGDKAFSIADLRISSLKDFRYEHLEKIFG